MGELANDKITGLACSHCGVYFRKAHGHPMVCCSCYQVQIKQAVPKRDRTPQRRHKEL